MKLSTYVCLYDLSDGELTVRWVTSTQGSQFYLDSGKPALRLSEAHAREIVEGATYSYYMVAMVKLPYHIDPPVNP